MIHFTDEQIKRLSAIAHEKELGILMSDNNFGDILDYSGNKTGFKLEQLLVKEKGIADIGITLNLGVPDGQPYHMRDLKFDIDNLLGWLKKFGIEKSRVAISFNELKFNHEDGPKYLRSDITIGQLSELEDEVKSRYNGSVYCSEYLPDTSYDTNRMWTIDQVKNANCAIESLASIIQAEKLSPIEAIAFIALFAKKNIHFANDSTGNFEKTNTIVAAINNKQVQCVGYAQFFEAVVGELWDYFRKSGDYLEAEQRNLVMTINKNFGGHSLSQAFIKDKKYNVNGSFLVDIGNGIELALKRKMANEESDRVWFYVFEKDYVAVKNETGEIVVIDKKSNKKRSLGSFSKKDHVPTTISVASQWNAGYVKQNMEETFKQDISKPRIGLLGLARIIFKKRMGSPLHVLRLSKTPVEKILKTLGEAYDNISNIEIPTIEQLLAGRKEEHKEGAEK